MSYTVKYHQHIDDSKWIDYFSQLLSLLQWWSTKIGMGELLRRIKLLQYFEIVEYLQLCVQVFKTFVGMFTKYYILHCNVTLQVTKTKTSTT